MQPFKLAGAVKRLSLLCSFISAAFSYITLALNENVLWKRVGLELFVPLCYYSFSRWRNYMEASMDLPVPCIKR